MIISRRVARILRELDVLVVDDNDALTSTVEKLLQSLGVHSVDTERNGASALAVLQSWPANLIITDICMEPMDGCEFTRRVRSGEGSIDPRTPIIAMTGNADPKTVNEALVAGVNGFLVKPIDPDTLVRRIEKVITTRVIYQLKNHTYTANPRAKVPAANDLVYDGILPRADVRIAKTVENPTNKGDEGGLWVLD